MSLLPTTTDVCLVIASLSENVVVRIYEKSTGKEKDYTPSEAVMFLNCYSMEVIEVSQKTILLGFQNGRQILLTFHKKILTQIGIEALS